MSTYGNNSGGSQSSGGSSGYSPDSGSGRVYSEPRRGEVAPVPQNDPFNGPGSVNFDLTDPQGSVDKAAQETGDVFGGLKTFLFGTDQGDVTGKHGGVLNIGDVPLVGDVLRGGANVIGVAGGAAVGGIAAGIGGSLERVPADASANAAIEAEFNALPDDSEAKKAALAQMGKDTGLFGTGLLSGKGHYMSQAIQQHEDEALAANPNLWSGLFRPSASLADTVSNLFGALGASQRGTERLIAGAGRPGQGGLNQLQMIMAVGDGNAVWNADDPGLTAVEQTAYEKYKSGEWGETEALDFISSHGAGLSHSKLTEIAGSMAADPLNIATLGAGALAKFGETGMLLSRTLKAARTGLADAEAAGDVEKAAQFTKAIEVAEQGIKTGRAGKGVRNHDLLGRLAKRQWTGAVARRYGQLYGELEGTTLGKAAKITRTVIDPMHAIGGNPRGASAIEEGSHEVTQAVVNAHGEFAHIDTIRHFRGLDGGEEFARQYNEGMGIYSGNVFRRVAGRQFRAVQMMMPDKGEGLLSTKPFEALSGAVAGMKRRGLTQLEEEAGQFVKSIWSEEDDINLSARMATLWGGRSAEEWLPELAKMGGQQKSLIHAATYGSAVKALHVARAADRATGGMLALAHGDWDRIVLLNRRTLTDLGHEGILNQLEGAGDVSGKLAVIEQARRTYPELRSFVVDETDAQETISNFLDMMERRKNYLPAQVRNAERSQLPDNLRDFDALITPNGDPEQAVFTLGFRPEQEFLWGLERDSDDVLREVHDPWMDQASDIFGEYAPVREVPTNIAGMPIVGALATKTAKALDFTEAVGRMAMHGVTGKMVSQQAHIKFVEKVAARYVGTDGKTPLMTAEQVEGIWKALMAKVEDSENISGVRGLSADAIWHAARTVIPRYAEEAGLGRRELLVHVLDAYDGDLRYIGLTQKLSSKVKLAAGLTGNNSAGMIAEHAWPLLKFKLNPFFQLQEKIEPWILSATRGARVALGTRMDDVDAVTAAVYRNYAEKGLINIADNDIGELANTYLIGSRLTNAANHEGGKLNGAFARFEGLADVQGTKQLAMLRTFKKGVGKTFRESWDETRPGEFDRMLDAHRALVGEVIDEDDFAIMLIHNNLAANEIPIDMIDGKPVMNFENAILEGQWSAPQNLGEMRALNLDYMARRLALRNSNGDALGSSMDIRRALADGTLSQQDISRSLRSLGAHPDYVARVESAMSFSAPEFWRQAAEVYGMTPAERMRLEGMFVNIARSRGMTASEYMSQVWSPNITRGTDYAIGSLGNLVGAMRGGMPTPDLGQLRGIAGQTDIQDFYRQAGAIMSAHLDPSAKRAFLLDMMDQNGNHPTIRLAAARGEILTDMHEIEAAWGSGAQDALSQRIMNFLQGQPGSGPHDLVANEATGIESIRNAATEWRGAVGRPRNTQRFISHDDAAIERELADALDNMPQIYQHVATEADLATVVKPADAAGFAQSTAVSFKNGFSGYPESTKAAMETRVLTTRHLYNKMTRPRSEGGLGIKVISHNGPNPYRSADAMRADIAAGKIRVPRSGHWHPLMLPEDVFMERAVGDVFGHGQEANALGSHDAIMNAVAMYPSDAQASLLTDGFARTAWERSSAKVIDAPVAEPATIAEYETRYGEAADRTEVMAAQGLGDQTAIQHQSRTLGTGIRALPEEVQREAISTLSTIRNQFPGVGLDAFDIHRIPAAGMTMAFELEHPTIVLNVDSGWQADQAVRDAHRADRLAIDRNTAGDTHIRNAVTGAMEPRQATPGTPMFTSATPTGDMWHEFGHAVDIMLHKRARVVKNTNYGSTRMTKLMRKFKGSEAQKMLSEYSYNPSTMEALRDTDMFAELFDLSFNPEQAEVVEQLFGTELGDVVNELRSALKDEGIWHPDGGPLPVNPHAGKTVAEANLAGAGLRAPHKIGMLPQATLDNVTQHFIGSGRYAESNPDVGRMAGYLRDHMMDTLGYTLETGTASPYAHMFDALSGIPITDPVPFNLTEAVMWHGAAQMMAAKWEDAFRLQYFAQKRSMLQRSLNHPMFGLYPASYMWGKIGPEMVRFIAKEPFGMKTGALAYTLSDLQKAVAVQRQYDPDMEKSIDGLGSSAALQFLGFMLPATPWDVPASYPAWLRSMADQGLENQQNAANGGTVADDDFVTPLKNTLKKIAPFTTQVPFLDRALKEVGDALPWNQQPAEAPAVFNDAGTSPLSAPTAPPAAEAPQSAPTTGSVPATGLTAVLTPEMRSLTDMLSGV